MGTPSTTIWRLSTSWSRRSGSMSRRGPREESRELVSLVDPHEGDSAEIVRVTEQDGGLLTWFEAEGFMPGAKVAVRDIQPAAGHRKIQIGGAEQFIADRAARALYVRPERP